MFTTIPSVTSSSRTKGSSQASFILYIFAAAFLYGIYKIIREYYYSEYQFVYWLLCGVLVGLFALSRIYVQRVPVWQGTALFLITTGYFVSWLIIPHFLRFGLFLFATLCFLYAGTLLYNKGSKLLRALFMLALAVSTINIAAILFFIAEGSPLSRELINTLFISNTNEIREYLIGKVSFLHLAVLVLFGLGIYMLLTKKAPSASQEKLNGFVLPLFLLGFTLSTFSGPIGSLSTEYILYLQYKALLEKMVADRAQGLHQQSIAITSDPGAANKIMIIIGESLNKEYMSLYGFPQNTTPRLTNLSRDTTGGRLFHFTNVISPEANTVSALRKILTNISNQEDVPFEKSTTLVELFEKAGYETFWLSNQASIGKHNTPNAVISGAADHLYYTAYSNNRNERNSQSGVCYDAELIGLFNKFATQKNNSDKQVFFLHLMGSHWLYNERYPPQYDVFKSGKSDTHNTYLNSILYNDYVVSELIRQARGLGFEAICYFSDHGEDLEFAHNQEKYRKGMSTIPFMVYLSDDYMKRRPSLVREMDKNRNTPAMTDNFFHDIQHLSGFRSSLYRSQHSFLTDSYIPRKRKVVNGRIAFD